MQKLLLAVLVVGAGYVAWTEYGGQRGMSFSASSGSGGPGFNQFPKATGNVTGAVRGVVGN